MLKILQAQLQQYMNRELPDVQAGFIKGRGTRDQIPNITGSLKKQDSSRKTSTSALLIMPKSLTVWLTINWKILKEMGIPDHLTCLLRNLHAVFSGDKQSVLIFPSLSEFSTLFCGPHSQRLSCSQWSRSRCFSGTLLLFQWMLAIWTLVLLPFLNPAGTSGTSQFTYYWGLAWRILSITLLACEMSATVQ